MDRIKFKDVEKDIPYKEDRIEYLNGTKFYIGEVEDGYADYLNFETNEIYNSRKKPAPCPNCKKEFMDFKSGWVDPCLGILPGVENACCGHGVRQGYVHFSNGKVIRFPGLIDLK